MVRKDYAGKKFHRLTFIAPTDKRMRRGNVVWEAICECGKTVYTIPCRASKSCGCLTRDKSRERLKARALQLDNPARKYDPILSSARSVWHMAYKDCSFDTFLQLSQLPCNYCGLLPHRTYNIGNNRKDSSDLQKKNGNFTYNGLDRIDSSKGHTQANVVPCCTTCNVMKMALGVEEFLAHINRIYLHQASSSKLMWSGRT